jgi:DoxX-like family
MGISLFYAVTGTILVPRLWVDPLGPMAKIAVVITLQLVALSIVDER